ncbi:MAG: glycosyltransferase family 39 protein [Chitinophagales bacterium]
MRVLPFAFFTLTLALGIFLSGDYGISWDEPIQNALGNASWNYVLHGSTDLFQLQNQYHGGFVEMLENVPWRLFHWTEPATIFLSRHLANYLIFWLGTIFLFLIGRELRFDRQDLHKAEIANHRIQSDLSKSLTALLPVILLYLTPRIFAQSFYNSKDIPLLSYFIIGNYFLLRFLKKPSITLALVFAMVSGMAFSIRVLGILIPVFAVTFFIINILNENIPKRSLKYLAGYLLLTTGCCILFSPVLWHDPVGGLQKSFLIFSHYPYNDAQFFMGNLHKPQQLPWYYIPVWMGITLPVMWQLFFFIGLISVAIIIIRSAKDLFRSSWPWLLIASWCILPGLIVLILDSAVYDEWRHLFFIYPACLLIAMRGISVVISPSLVQSILKKSDPEKTILSLRITIAAIITQAVFLLQFMIANHPYEHVYFNLIAGNNPEKKFDLDYWGLSYRQGLQYLVKHANEDTIKACWANAPGNYNLAWLNKADRQRIREMPYDSSEYFITNFRFHPDQYKDSAWHTIKVNDFTILAIEKLH